MTAHTVHPGCKVNLFLEIRCRRPDGYHELATLFWPLAHPTDTLTVTPGAPGSGLRFSCSDPALAGPENLVARAYAAFVQAAEQSMDVAAHLEKRIPVGAGLGGGSADAAAMLLVLNQLAGANALPASRLASLAAALGADVPFFLQGGRPCLAEGIGERLTPVDIDLSEFMLVLCSPAIPVSTAWAYATWDSEHGKMPGGGNPALTSPFGTRKDVIFTDAVVLFNSFEPVVLPREPRLTLLKDLAYRAGAAGVLLSGSGSSVFALFRNSELAGSFARQAEALAWIGPGRVFSSHM
ncbi:putative 4-diphosphocytidyl-2-C-methyl-D-erythritol kinase [Megalodesulfovibrio gigas DSM 1382 = ATCC 19364]|uniref:4-diphosphocytidyl-2-C-methyl-D-erythritol kinase n=2 Tax=Megalodesulfovibrio gigas TaxID=879 RepID=T2GET0_MEGG1|nr:putative 4-diphosphocytidyl-2-C-methyl-D-erythritol kinase [Megalodesulfovibrio gigas DSM 1382 = ATCC 19364]